MANSCNNLPWQIIEANKGKLITWCIALDNDKTGRAVVSKYLAQIRKMKEIDWVARGKEGHDRDYEQRFQAIQGVEHSRIVQCRTQVMAAAKATQGAVPGLNGKRP